MEKPMGCISDQIMCLGAFKLWIDIFLNCFALIIAFKINIPKRMDISKKLLYVNISSNHVVEYACSLLFLVWRHFFVPDSQARAAIFQAITEFNAKTCIRFVPRRSERNYINIIASNAWVFYFFCRLGWKKGNGGILTGGESKAV